MTELLFNDEPALATLLRRSTAIYFHNLNPGAFSLGFQNAEEAIPSCITDRSGKPMVPDQSLDVQAFHSDHTVTTDQTQSYLMMMFPPKIADSCVKFCDFICCLATVLAALLLAGYASLFAAQFWQGVLQVRGVGFVSTVRCGQEGFDSNVDTYRRIVARRNVDISKITRDGNIPFIILSLDGQSLDRSFYGSMQLDSNYPDMLNMQTITFQCCPTTIGRAGKGIESTSRLEPWVSRLLLCFNPAKETIECAINPTDCVMCGPGIDACIPRVSYSINREFGCLRKVADIHFVSLIPFFSLRQAGIVEMPMRIKHRCQFTLLINVREESVFEPPKHRSLPCLMEMHKDILATDTTNTSGKLFQHFAETGRLPEPEGGKG